MNSLLRPGNLPAKNTPGSDVRMDSGIQPNSPSKPRQTMPPVRTITTGNNRNVAL